MKNGIFKYWIISLMLIIFIGFITDRAEGARVYGTLSNFDIHNFTNVPVNDFDLILRGNGLTCAHIIGYYSGWGTHMGQPKGGCQDLGGGRIRITWSDPNNPIPPSQMRHFGVQFGANAPIVMAEEAIWTVNGVQVGRISFIWQTWIGTAECPVGDVIWPPDIIPQSPDPTRPWNIIRRWAWTQDVIPLDNLTQNDSLVTRLQWSTNRQEVMQNDSLVMWTTPLPQRGAVIFQYEVRTGGVLQAVFTNEAILEIVPTMTEWGLIILAILILSTAVWIIYRRRARLSV